MTSQISFNNEGNDKDGYIEFSVGNDKKFRIMYDYDDSTGNDKGSLKIEKKDSQNWVTIISINIGDNITTFHEKVRFDQLATIGGSAFDGIKDLTLSGVNSAGNQTSNGLTYSATNRTNTVAAIEQYLNEEGGNGKIVLTTNLGTNIENTIVTDSKTLENYLEDNYVSLENLGMDIKDHIYDTAETVQSYLVNNYEPKSDHSDNRIKHNEKNVNNALDIIDKLKPQTYFKTTKLFSENYNFNLDSNNLPITEEKYTIETGFIAQDILEIDQLKHLVKGGDIKNSSGEIEEKPYSLDYKGIFAYNVKAVQELNNKNIQLENRVKQLESQIESLTKLVNQKLN